MNGLRCYHHCNSEEHPAVAQCSVCGKGLCRECADRLTSPNTGRLLCADCLNRELEQDRQHCLQHKARSKREALFIILGLAVGIGIEIFLGVMYSNSRGELWKILFPLSFVFFLPTLLASLGTIVSTVGNTFENTLFRIVFFLILVVLSPIMFIVRLTRRIKSAKRWKKLALIVEQEQDANNRYKIAAGKINERRESIEEIENALRSQYAKQVADMKISHADAERRIKEEARQKYTKQINEQQIEIEKLGKKIAELEPERQAIKNDPYLRRRERESRRRQDVEAA